MVSSSQTMQRFPSRMPGELPPGAQPLMRRFAGACGLAITASVTTLCTAGAPFPLAPVALLCVIGGASGVAAMLGARNHSRVVREHQLQAIEAEERIANLTLLNSELVHRSKNALAVVGVIADRTLAHATDIGTARVAISDRLKALASANGCFSYNEEVELLLTAIIATVVRPHDAEGGRVTCNGPLVYLPARAALGFTLALHELATNAVKYGALSQPGGHVEIRWAIRQTVSADQDDVVDSLELSWREVNGPPVRPPTHRGFGSVLIQKAVDAYMGGRGEFDFSPSGLRFSVEAPLPTRSA